MARIDEAIISSRSVMPPCFDFADLRFVRSTIPLLGLDFVDANFKLYLTPASRIISFSPSRKRSANTVSQAVSTP